MAEEAAEKGPDPPAKEQERAGTSSCGAVASLIISLPGLVGT